MKKMFRILFVVTVLMSLFVISASAAQATCNDHTNGWTLIEYNTKITDAATYGYKYDSVNKCIEIVRGGQYYLSGNIPTYISINRAGTENINVTLCLNGQNITGSYGIRVGEKTELAVLQNCQPGGGTVQGTGGRGLLMMTGSTTEMHDNVHIKSDNNTRSVVVQANVSTFIMYGGTISGNKNTSSGIDSGTGVTAVLWGSRSEIKLLGGEMSNNKVTAGTTNDSTKGIVNTTHLATVVISSKKVDGGTTYEGSLTIGGDFIMDNNEVVDTYNFSGTNRASGILAIGDNPTVDMSGGTISNNKGGYSGGVRLETGTFTMRGGTISGNEGVEYGGGVDLIGGTMTMSGGIIENNKLTGSKPYGTQVAVRKNTTTTALTMTNGVIRADNKVSSNDLTVLRGIADISGGTITGNVGTVGAGAPATLKISGGTISGNLSDEVPHPGVGIHADCTITLTGGRFSSDTQLSKLEGWLSGVTLTPMTIDGKLFYRAGALGTGSCSCSGSTPISTAQTISTGGKYCLSTAITGQIVVTAQNVTLCLHGKTLTNSSNPAILCSGGNLNIVNGSEAGGTIKSNGGVACVQVTAGGSVTIGDNVHIDGATSLTTAPVVVEADSSFTMNGGSISGNQFTASESYAGGAILAEGTVALNCGVISGNKLTAATYGSGAVTMNGGTLTMGEQVLITANTTNKNGGGVALYGTSVFDMTGGIISGNTAGNTGGGIDVADGVLILDGAAKITTNKNTGGQYGSGVCLRNGTMTMNGGEISENAMASSDPFGTQVTCGLWASGTNVFTMNGGTIKATADGLHKQSSKANGFNAVTVCHGTMTMNGGTIVGDLATVGVLLPAKLEIAGGAVYGLVSEGSVTLPIKYEEGGHPRKDCTNSISGGKFSDATELLSEDGLSGLKAWLDGTEDVLSVVDIDEGELAYEVVNGFYSDSEHMDFQSALDMSLYLYADAGFDPSLFDADEYVATVSGGYTPVLETQSDIACLIFTAKGIAAKEMRDDITFTLENKETGAVMFTKTLSVYDAVARWYEKYEGERTMWADMIHYGTQAQKRFNYNTRSLLTKPDLSGTSETVDSSSWTSAGISVTGEQGSKVSVSLSLKEQIELNFYIRDAKAKVTDVMFGGVALEQTEYTVTNSTGTNDAYTLVSFCEIPVKLAKETACFAVELSNGTQFTVSGSIVDYVDLAAGNSTEEKLIDALQKYVDSVIDLLPADSSDVDTGAVAAYVSVEGVTEQ